MTTSQTVKILLIFGPILLRPDLMTKKLGEITANMDKNWKLFILTGHLPKQYKALFNLSCLFEFNSVTLFGSSKSPFARILYLLNCIIKGVKIVKEQNIHVITQHDGHLEYGIIAYFISRLTHRKCLIRINEDTLIPLIYFLRASGIRLFNKKSVLKFITYIYRKIEIEFLKHVDWILTHGPMDFKKFKRVNNRITFVPLWVDFTKFNHIDKEIISQFRSKFVTKKNVKLLLFVGRLHPEKGIPTLLRALKVLNNMKYLLLLVYSFSDYKAEYEKLAEKLKISDKIRFIGYVPHDELSYYYNSADLSILPSIREEWSNTIMESMACKTIIIASDVGANPYLIDDGISGLLFQSENYLDLAQKIKFVFTNPALSRKIEETALKKIKAYDKEKIGELYKNVVKKLIFKYFNS